MAWIRGQLSEKGLPTSTPRPRGTLIPDYLRTVSETKPKRTIQTLYLPHRTTPLPPAPLKAVEDSLRRCPICHKFYSPTCTKTKCHKCHLWVCGGTCCVRKRVPSNMHQAAFRTFCSKCNLLYFTSWLFIVHQPFCYLVSCFHVCNILIHNKTSSCRSFYEGTAAQNKPDSCYRL